MTEQTLLVIFIGLTAVAWVSMAIIAVLVGWQVYKLIYEAREVVQEARKVGHAAVSEVKQLHDKIQYEGAKLQGVLGLITNRIIKKFTPARRKKE